MRPVKGDPLTPSQLAVIVLLANGQSVQQIARDNAIRVNTVYGHRHAAFVKLGVQTLNAAVRELMNRGVLSWPDVAYPPVGMLLGMVISADRRAERYRGAWLSARRRSTRLLGILNKRRAHDIWEIARAFAQSTLDDT